MKLLFGAGEPVSGEIWASGTRSPTNNPIQAELGLRLSVWQDSIGACPQQVRDRCGPSSPMSGSPQYGRAPSGRRMHGFIEGDLTSADVRWPGST
jgi:hypothetical protein